MARQLQHINWRDQVLEEARTILIQFCKANRIPKGRRIAKRVVAFALDPQGVIDEPLTELELFIAMDALGDERGEDAEEEFEILFQFVRWSWWMAKHQQHPEQRWKRPHEVEAEVFRRPRPGVAERLRPSDN